MSWSCDIEELTKFISISEPNTKFIYYVGYNISETVIGRELAKITYDLSIKGRIYLVQRRADYWNFDYIAVKASIIPIRTLVPFSDEKRTKERSHVQW